VLKSYDELIAALTPWNRCEPLGRTRLRWRLPRSRASEFFRLQHSDDRSAPRPNYVCVLYTPKHRVFERRATSQTLTGPNRQPSLVATRRNCHNVCAWQTDRHTLKHRGVCNGKCSSASVSTRWCQWWLSTHGRLAIAVCTRAQ
jgi:hypothetical protein